MVCGGAEVIGPIPRIDERWCICIDACCILRGGPLPPARAVPAPQVPPPPCLGETIAADICDADACGLCAWGANDCAAVMRVEVGPIAGGANEDDAPAAAMAAAAAASTAALLAGDRAFRPKLWRLLPLT